MKITSARVETIYEIEYSFEDFIEAANDEDWSLGRQNAFMIDGVHLRDMSEEDQLKVFRKKVHTLMHGDTYSVIAKHLGFDGWKNAGLYNERKDVRTMTVYREGDDL